MKQGNFALAILRSMASGLALAALLAACGEKAPESAPQSTQTTAANQKDAGGDTAGAGEEAKDMVAGVTLDSKPGAPVDLKFKLGSRPEAGQTLAITLALYPRANTDAMRATFIATEGLSVTPSSGPAEFSKVQSGSVYHYTLNVVPREDGIYYVSVIVLMELANGAEVRTFNIPVIVGAPDAVKPAAKPAPAADATGQPVQSMPANKN
jgi:hypothetical protein